ncbi:hypothetical protein ACB092_01G411200 [Castanea dentata]
MSKNITFNISKHYFINYNTPLYNIPYIKCFIFFITSLKYYLFIIYNSFLFYLSLFLCVCFSSLGKNNQPIPLWPPPNTTHSMSPPTTNPQPTTKSINPHPPKKNFTRERLINPRPQHPTTHGLNPPAHHNQQLPPKPQTHKICQNPKQQTHPPPTTNLFEKITTIVI